MKKISATAFLIFLFTCAVQAQFYYRDIISNNQLTREMALYKESKVRSVIIKSYEDDGSESEGFFCEKTLSKNYKKTELFTRSDVSGASLFTSWFNNEGQLLHTNDSSAISVSVNTYTYDEKKRVKSIVSSIRSADDDFVNEILEEHIYFYNDKNLPEKMIRVKNKYDSTNILFLPDEKNNVSIEKDSKSGSKYYYYYDEKNRLTDIVHSYEYKAGLTAEYIFEYNNANQLSQMTTTEEGGSNYYVWKYSYINGLRSGEKCYSKEKRLLGRIEYEYK
jgi:hypothetical protein